MPRKKIFLALFAVLWSLPAHAGPVASFDADGALLTPKNYREWVFIGTTVSPNDLNFGSAYAPGIKHT